MKKSYGGRPTKKKLMETYGRQCAALEALRVEARVLVREGKMSLQSYQVQRMTVRSKYLEHLQSCSESTLLSNYRTEDIILAIEEFEDRIGELQEQLDALKQQPLEETEGYKYNLQYKLTLGEVALALRQLEE